MKFSKKTHHKRSSKTSQLRSEKLQKVIARLGYGSRREVETWIRAGRVRVNKRFAQLGDRVTIADRIQLDNKPIKQIKRYQKPTRVLLYHKPPGELCTRSDPQGRPTVFQRQPYLQNKQWIMIGRLDFNTSGVLLFTNNGMLAEQLMHPRHQIEREYAVRVFGEPNQKTLKTLQEGVELNDGIGRFESIEFAGGTGMNQWYHVTLTEGRNRQVKRLWESQGYQVTRLIRVRFGPIMLPRRLHQGQLITLSAHERQNLQALIKQNH